MKLTAPAAARARVAKLDPSGADHSTVSVIPEPRADLDPEAATKVAAKKAAARERNNRVRTILEARYPRLFGFAQPLAVGIYHEIKSTFGDEISAQNLSGFLAFWTRRAEYKAALARGVRRKHLDGSDAGPALQELAAPGGCAQAVAPDHVLAGQ